MENSNPMKAVVLSFPLNPRSITDKLLSDIAKINHVGSSAVYGSNMRLVKNSSTRIKLYLPCFSDDGFSTTFSVSGDMSDERLTRLLAVYGLAASLKKFDFVHYVAGSHLIVCMSISSNLLNNEDDYKKAIESLNGLQDFVDDVQNPA